MSFKYGIFNDNIFSIPIDQEENDIINRSMISDNPQNQLKNNSNFVSEIKRNNNKLNNIRNENENTLKNYKNNISWIVFSVNKNKREIKSSANSSKLYACEIFGYNWKFKIKKFLINNKLKYIELVKNMDNNKN